MLAYVERHNAEPKPFRWTRSADEILASVGRFCERTLAVHRPDLQQTSETRPLGRLCKAHSQSRIMPRVSMAR